MSAAPSAAWEAFASATTFKAITHAFFHLCLTLDVDPSDYANLYTRIRQLDEWKAQKLFKLLDKRVSQPEYAGGSAARHFNVLVIGAGPCGLRAAIEAALLGCRVVLVEQRDKFSRNNVLHLWEFVITDLKGLGAKFFYPRFCTGSIEHISIRQLQCILLKVALLFGVQVYDSISFKQLLCPTTVPGETANGFRALLEPSDHILSSYEFDVLIGADGKRNTVPGFPREEMRGKLAIGITANFLNRRSAEEERVPEISGVAYIFNQSFFKEMLAVTGVDLENIVYYKDDTHYFVMCAKKQSLLEKGAIRKDFDDVTALLSPSNVDEDALCRFAASAADFATRSRLPCLDFATNQRGRPDVAMFDFTSLYSSKCSVRVVESAGRSLLLSIVGDSLHEPFWPTGSGCARGFLGVWDTAWLIRQLGVSKKSALELIAERESVFRLLTQVTKDNMHKNLSKYTIDPRTRYISLEMSVKAEDVQMLRWSDGEPAAPLGSSSQPPSLFRLFSAFRFCLHVLGPFKLKLHNLSSSWRDGRALGALLAKFLPQYLDYVHLISLESEAERVASCLEVAHRHLGLAIPSGEWSSLSDSVLSAFICNVVTALRSDDDRILRVLSPRPSSAKRKSTTLRRPVDASKAKKSEPIERLARDVLACYSANGTPKVDSERVGRVQPMTPLSHRSPKTYTKRPLVERLNPELVHRVEKIVTGELLKEEEREQRKEKERKAEKSSRRIGREEMEKVEERLRVADEGKAREGAGLSPKEEKLMRVRAADARREAEAGFTREAERSKFKEVDEVLARSGEQQKRAGLAGLDTVSGYRMLHERSARKRPPPPLPPPKPAEENGVVLRKLEKSPPRRVVSLPSVEPSRVRCGFCEKPVYLAEQLLLEGVAVHRRCFKCSFCLQPLRLGEAAVDKDLDHYHKFRFYCKAHIRLPLREKLAKIERNGKRSEKAAGIAKAVSVDHTPESVSSHSSTPSSRHHSIVLPSSSGRLHSVSDPPPPTTSTPPSTPPTSTAAASSSTLFFFSPNSLRDRVSRRLDEAADGERPTPERAEFSLLQSPPREQQPQLSPSDSSTEGEEGEDSEGEEEKESKEKEEEEIVEEEEEEAELADDELAELEKTVLELEDDAADTCSQLKALSIIESINTRRRSSLFPLEQRQQDSELEVKKEEARQRARMKSDEQLGIKTTSGGLLSRLFPPLKQQTPSVDGDDIQSESGKETTLLSRGWRRMKTSRTASVEKEEDGGKGREEERGSKATPTRMAVVAPSPRPSSQASSILSTDEASVRMVQKRVSRMKRQREEDRRRSGQSMQRTLDEIDTTLDDLTIEGTRVERILCADPTNTRLLERWLSVVQQRERLLARQQDLQLKAKELQLDEQYRCLNQRFKQLSDDVDDSEQSSLLSEMLAAIKARAEVRADAEALRSRQRAPSPPHVVLQRHVYNFLNFKPVFT